MFQASSRFGCYWPLFSPWTLHAPRWKRIKIIIIKIARNRGNVVWVFSFGNMLITERNAIAAIYALFSFSVSACGFMLLCQNIIRGVYIWNDQLSVTVIDASEWRSRLDCVRGTATSCPAAGPSDCTAYWQWLHETGRESQSGGVTASIWSSSARSDVLPSLHWVSECVSEHSIQYKTCHAPYVTRMLFVGTKKVKFSHTRYLQLMGDHLCG